MITLYQFFNNLDCLIIDNFKNNIDQKLFYSLLNQSKQQENFILINSLSPDNNNSYSLADLNLG